MSILRPLLLLGLVVGACFASMTFSEHHAATNENAFVALYSHVLPHDLVMPASGDHDADAHADGEPADEHADGEHADEAADGEHADEAADGEHADEAADGEHADEHADGEHADEHADGEHADEAADGEHADEAADGEHADEAADEHAEPGGEHHAKDLLFTVTVPLPALFDKDPAQAGTQLAMSNLQIFQLVAVLFILIAFSGVPAYLRTGRGDPLSRLGAGFCQYIRDEMVEPNMHGHFGRRFLPYFLSVFFFIMMMNLMGLVPGGATPTASIFVTAALAVTTLLAMIGCGMAAQGPVAFWKNLVPHVPTALWPLMFIVEVLGLFVKPFALMIRLFANMTGGHMVVLSFMGLIFFFATPEFSNMGYVVSPLAVGFAVFIMIIEGFVALLQAYIFTQLSILFVGAAVHPEH